MSDPTDDDLPTWVQRAPDELITVVAKVTDAILAAVAAVDDEHLKATLVSALGDLHHLVDPEGMRRHLRPYLGRLFAATMELDPSAAQRLLDGMPEEERRRLLDSLDGDES